MKSFKLRSLFILAVLGCLIPLSVKAQVTSDGTTSTIVNQDGNNFTIEQGDRAGDNLFHSFSEFSVPTLGSAVFNNAGDISNIFSRVTGSNISNIDGVLGANGAANLYLINPNGIIFGQNASLNLGGSFFASTADSLLFEGNTEFSASNPQASPLLEIGIPVGARFRDNPGDIVNLSFARSIVTGNFDGIRVSPENNITLLGGNIDFIGAALIGTGGNINLGGLSSTGTVNISDNGTLAFPGDTIQSDINFIGSLVSVSGSTGGDININGQNLNLQGLNTENASNLGLVPFNLITASISPESTDNDIRGGDININIIEDIVIDFSAIENNTNGVNSSGNGEINGGNINITASNLTVTDTGLISRERTGGTINTGTISVQTFGRGNAGNINIAVDNLQLLNGDIIADTNGQGNGGNIDIVARENTLIDNQLEPPPESSPINLLIGEDAREELEPDNINNNIRNISTSVLENAEGNGGEINVSTNNLEVINDGQIASDVFGQGDAGVIEIEVLGNLNVSDGGTISANTFGRGNAGRIEIDVGENLTIDGTTLDRDSRFLSGILSLTAPEALGDSQGIKVVTTNLNLIDGGQINANANGRGNSGLIEIIAAENINIERQNLEGNPSGIFSVIAPETLGNSQGVKISTTNLNLANGGAINASTFGLGNSGSIDITAAESINISGENSLNSFGVIISQVGFDAVGNSQGIKISTTNLNLVNGGQINSITFGQGNAGDITIDAQESISIADTTEFFRGGILANALVDSGNGGNINIFAEQLTVRDSGTIEASNLDTLNELEEVAGKGEPGNINIEVGSLSLSDRAIINATTQSETGNSANINLTVTEDIILENNSSISARALENANGGNLTINVDDGFILASPNGNNDIIASAAQGNGGQINIFTQALFGLEERSSTPANLTNDIDASSEFGLQGDFSLNTPDFDPTTGLINLPASVGDASDRISQNPCQQGVGSEFIVTGKGGLSPTVNEALNGEEVSVGLIEPLPVEKKGAEESRRQGANINREETSPAMGWVFNDKGEVTLTAYSNTKTKRQNSARQLHTSCSSQN